MTNPNEDRLLTPAEVARMYGVDPRTVGRWVKAYDLPCVTTPGGHRRYRTSVVKDLIGGRTAAAPQDAPQDAPGPKVQALPPAQVARMFGVNAKTVVRWANAGLISCFRTPGGVRRFDPAEIAALLNGETPEAGSR